MNNKSNFALILVLVTLLLFVIAFNFSNKAMGELNAKIENYDNKITSLETYNEYLSERLSQAINYYEYDMNYSDDSFNYLAIGNSLTLINEWGRGICSTQPNNDYVHLIQKYLQTKVEKIVVCPYNFAIWERSLDRSSVLNILDIYLSDKLDLITIQLGENCKDLSTYENDLVDLVSYISQKCPKAQIIMIGDFWSIDRNTYRINASAASSIQFADLSEIINNSEYQSKEGTVCYLDDGSTIEVSNAAQTHPGDKGMRYIADAIISKIN